MALSGDSRGLLQPLSGDRVQTQKRPIAARDYSEEVSRAALALHSLALGEAPCSTPAGNCGKCGSAQRAGEIEPGRAPADVICAVEKVLVES